MTKVIKRDGRKCDFEKNKIKQAILKAFEEVDGTITSDAKNKANEIVTYINTLSLRSLEVEKIQDIVEEKLMASKRKDVARSFVRYRYKRELIREARTDLDYEILGLKNGTSEEIINNANKDGKKLQTLKPMIADVTIIDQAKRFFIPEKILKHHQKEIYIHDMNYFGIPIFNCFDGDTKFITNYGVKKFNDFDDGDIVQVKDKDGIWRDATVKQYGEQEMYVITLKSCKTVKEIVCTKNHRWILTDGSITTNIKVGDKLSLLVDSSEFVPNTFDEKRYFCLGMILGYGGEFPPKIRSGYKKEYFLNNHSWKLLPLNLKIALFNGYYAAVGSTDRNEISTNDIRLCKMIEDISALSGYYISSYRHIERDTNYKKKSKLHIYNFIKSQKIDFAWNVVSIEPLASKNQGYKKKAKPKIAWCVEEPITHSFTLDGGIVTGNCCLINWQDCFENGMVIGGAKIDKPKSFSTAIALISQLAAHVSSNCYGGITFPQLTKGLCQYAKMSLGKIRRLACGYINEDVLNEYSWKMLEKEINDGTQGLEYEIQTLTNSRGEVPFITIELDCIDLDASEEDQKIQHMIITSFLNQRIKGLTDGVTPVFPKMVFELKRGNNLETTDRYYDVFKMAVKCSSLRLYPDYLMYDKLVEVTGSYKPPMSCRSFLPALEKDDKPYMYGFNQGVVSINLPRLAIMAEHDETKFYNLLDEYMKMTVDALLIRHEQLKSVKAKQAPVLYQYGAIERLSPDDTIENLLYKDRSTISMGYVGLYNALIALYGEGFDTNKNMVDKGVQIIKYMKEYCQKLKDETNIGFSLYSTPAETLATKFCRSDISDFGVIKGVNDKGYYENSFHYPSSEDIIAFDKVDLESYMSKLATGGAIQYVEFGNMINNPEALEKIISYAYDKCHYFGVNVSSDRCYKCGYIGEMVSINETNNDFECPQCGNTDKGEMSVIRRLCGYLGSLSERPSVDGKMKEIANRVDNWGSKYN